MDSDVYHDICVYYKNKLVNTPHDQPLPFNMQFDQITTTISNATSKPTIPDTPICYRTSRPNSSSTQHRNHTTYGTKDLSKKTKLQCLGCKRWGHAASNFFTLAQTYWCVQYMGKHKDQTLKLAEHYSAYNSTANVRATVRTLQRLQYDPEGMILALPSDEAYSNESFSDDE